MSDRESWKSTVESKKSVTPAGIFVIVQIQDDGHGHAGQRVEPDSGIAVPGDLRAEPQAPFHEGDLVPAEALLDAVQRQEVGTREEPLTALHVERPDEASGGGDVLGAGQVAQDREPEEILVPFEEEAGPRVERPAAAGPRAPPRPSLLPRRS